MENRLKHDATNHYVNQSIEENMKKIYFAIYAGLLVCGTTFAQVYVDTSNGNVRVQSGKGGTVIVNSGVIEPDSDIEGVTIINSKVFIDGEEVPKGKNTFVSKKTKKRYSISWGKDGNIAVAEK